MNCCTKVIVLLMLVALTGCGAEPKSGKGFTLPDGDPEHGRETFLALKCHACHTVYETELPRLDSELEGGRSVQIGGRVTRIQTYGELVTSIINPSHRLAKGFKQATEPDMTTPDDADADAVAAVEPTGKQAEDAPGGQQPVSPMTCYNEVMTVNQLIDLVAFLQSHYELIEYDPTRYPHYYHTY